MPVLPVTAVALLILAASVKGVEITRLSMPRWVQNGTEDSVVLDCEYDYSEDDKRLVVKWFLNDDPEPIYQWIPELGQRYASDRIKGKLNMDYTVSPSSRHTQYRALNLMRPTTELSGKYSCYVVSLLNQDNEDQVMVVYAPPRNFDFNYTRLSSGEAANLTCEADGVFPMPQIALFRVDVPRAEPALVSGVKTVTTSHRGAYYVQVSREIRDWEMSEEPTLFECVLSIPGTDYENQRKILYPGNISGTCRTCVCVCAVSQECQEVVSDSDYLSKFPDAGLVSCRTDGHTPDCDNARLVDISVQTPPILPSIRCRWWGGRSRPWKILEALLNGP